MGVGAYNRTSRAIIKQIELENRAKEFTMMEELNGLPKYPDAGTPFGPIQFAYSHGIWWAECPTTGFGFHYKTLREAIKSWHVEITGYNYDTNLWTAIPTKRRSPSVGHHLPE
jgi:hypothetical protein